MRMPLFSAVMRWIELTGCGIALDNGAASAAQVGLGSGFAVEAEWDLLSYRVGTVAAETFVGENRPDVAVELNRTVRAHGGPGG